MTIVAASLSALTDTNNYIGALATSESLQSLVNSSGVSH